MCWEGKGVVGALERHESSGAGGATWSGRFLFPLSYLSRQIEECACPGGQEGPGSS